MNFIIFEPILSNFSIYVIFYVSLFSTFYGL